ncbi:MAG: peptidoglycan DD-metalloendopeptidase family protein [Clostridia bacterium]|nr:peptidoglycan DD-metalloendopeptidase family protein [Clostridia bacterium]
MSKMKDFAQTHWKIGAGVLASLVLIGILSMSFNGMLSASPVAGEVAAVSTTGVPTAASSDGETAAATMTPYQQKIVDDVKLYMQASLPGFAITVNNNEIAFFKSSDDAYVVLNTLKANFKETDKIYTNVYYKEVVDVVPTAKALAVRSKYDSSEESLYYITKGTDEQKIHEVKKGENFWVIASYYNVGVADLIKANPDVVPERLQIGQQISLIVPKPLITVATVEMATYEEPIPFDIEYEDNADMYKGEFKTKVAGTNGQRMVDAEIYHENGIEVGRLVLDEEILSDPGIKVVYRGTKDPPPRKGTGVLAKPTSRGVVTSEFGWRWGRRHNGIDIGVAIGTDVKAADGGVVIFSGTKGGYGKCVMIDHGANIVTLYAHNSKLYVQKGDKVFKGQLIAASGNTGVSTGPHLHFEVQKNGTPVNPRNYLKF